MNSGFTDSFAEGISYVDEDYLMAMNMLKYSMIAIISIHGDEPLCGDENGECAFWEYNNTQVNPPIARMGDYYVRIKGTDYLSCDNLFRNIILLKSNINQKSLDAKLPYSLPLRLHEFLKEASRLYSRLAEQTVFYAYKNMLNNTTQYYEYNAVVWPEATLDTLFYLSLYADLIYGEDYGTYSLGFPYSIALQPYRDRYCDESPKNVGLELTIESDTYGGIPVKLLFELLLKRHLDGSGQSARSKELYGELEKTFTNIVNKMKGITKVEERCNPKKLLKKISEVAGRDGLFEKLKDILIYIDNQNKVREAIESLCERDKCCINTIKLAALAVKLGLRDKRVEALAGWLENNNYLLLPLLIVSMLNGFLLVPNVTPRINSERETKPLNSEFEHDAMILGVKPVLNDGGEAGMSYLLKPFTGVFEITMSRDVEGKLKDMVKKLEEFWNKYPYCNGRPCIDFLCLIVPPKIFQCNVIGKVVGSGGIICLDDVHVCKYVYDASGDAQEGGAGLFIMDAGNLFDLRRFRYSVWSMLFDWWSESRSAQGFSKAFSA